MAEAKLAGRIGFERATGSIGAFVHGVALDESNPAVAAELVKALHEHGVLFFQFEEALDAAQFLGFSRLFGKPEETYQLSMKPGQTTRERKPEDGNTCIDSEIVPMKSVRIDHFHSDGTAMERPPQAAMLTPVALPEAGGDTLWASMYAAWDDLSSHYQRLLDGMEVRHGMARLPFLREQDIACVHPAVIRDAVTGRKALFVNANYSESIIGMSERESEELLQFLFRHIAAPEFQVRLRWRMGTVAVWEERVTQHRGVADFTGPRKLRRLTFAGDRPSA